MRYGCKQSASVQLKVWLSLLFKAPGLRYKQLWREDHRSSLSDTKKSIPQRSSLVRKSVV